MLYLAYGSNLHKQQMRSRCPAAQPVGKLMFQDARLVFRGVADVAYAPGYAVPCGVWRISSACERALDAYEGVGSGLYSKEQVELNDGQVALIYLMQDDGVMPPSATYADTIRQGYKDFGLAVRYLEEAITQSWERKEPSPLTAARRARQRVSTNHQRLARATMPEALAVKRMQQKAVL